MSRPVGLLLNPRLPEDSRRVHEQAWHLLRETIRQKAGAGAIGVLTSGSTGTVEPSQAVGHITVLSQAALEASAASVNRFFRFSSDTVWGLMLPLFHVGGYSIVVRSDLSGAKVAHFQKPWSAKEAVLFLRENNVSAVSIVPTQLFDLVEAGLEVPSSVQTVIVGGGRLESGLRNRARQLGWPVYESYGMTETCSQIAASENFLEGNGPTDRLKALGHFDLKSEPLTHRLLVKGPALFSGKIEVSVHGAKWTEPQLDSDGFFPTSDRVQLSLENGETYLEFLGRTVDVVKVLGENVDVAKIRRAISDLKLGHDAWMMDVIALANVRRENELVLVLETKDELLNDSQQQTILRKVQAELRVRLLPVEVPTTVRTVKEFPRSELGKVQYPKLISALT